MWNRLRVWTYLLNTVLRLIKALYGIKQAPREWHEEIDRYIKSLGYRPCVKDTCLYYKRTRTNRSHHCGYLR